jgi:hypothetical protein
MRGFLSFGFPLFLKVVIPGTVGVLALSPVLACVGIKLEIDAWFVKRSFSEIGLLFVGLVLSLGFILYFLDTIIYRFFEGYIGWPKFARKYFTNRLNKKIEANLEKAKRLEELGEAKSAEDEIAERRLWDWLMRFPLKGKRKKLETEAVLPTKMGNILWSYENYPQSRYGIEAIFYWPRLWLSLDSETKKEVDTVGAEADCLTYISFVLLCASMLNILTLLMDYFNIPTLLVGLIAKSVNSFTLGKVLLTPSLLLGMGIIGLALSWLSYRISLSFHVKYGGFFQSLFDLHRDRLVKMQVMTEELSDGRWERAWAYLGSGQRKCNECSRYFPSGMEKCPHCGNG